MVTTVLNFPADRARTAPRRRNAVARALQEARQARAEFRGIWMCDGGPNGAVKRVRAVDSDGKCLATIEVSADDVDMHKRVIVQMYELLQAVNPEEPPSLQVVQ